MDNAAPRWRAAIRIQRLWRSAIARRKVGRLVAARSARFAEVFDSADRLEAVLLIQTRMRIVLAKARVRQLKVERASGVVDAPPVTYAHPKDIDPSCFVFRALPPTDDEVLDLFDAIDVCNTGTIPRELARAVFDRLLSDLHPGDPASAFDRALPVDSDVVTPSALYFVVLRALAV